MKSDLPEARRCPESGSTQSDDGPIKHDSSRKLDQIYQDVGHMPRVVRQNQTLRVFYYREGESGGMNDECIRAK